VVRRTKMKIGVWRSTVLKIAVIKFLPPGWKEGENTGSVTATKVEKERQHQDRFAATRVEQRVITPESSLMGGNFGREREEIIGAIEGENGGWVVEKAIEIGKYGRGQWVKVGGGQMWQQSFFCCCRLRCRPFSPPAHNFLVALSWTRIFN
jgi:hypothetical protein